VRCNILDVGKIVLIFVLVLSIVSIDGKYVSADEWNEVPLYTMPGPSPTGNFYLVAEDFQVSYNGETDVYFFVGTSCNIVFHELYPSGTEKTYGPWGPFYGGHAYRGKFIGDVVGTHRLYFVAYSRYSGTILGTSNTIKIEVIETKPPDNGKKDEAEDAIEDAEDEIDLAKSNIEYAKSELNNAKDVASNISSLKTNLSEAENKIDQAETKLNQAEDKLDDAEDYFNDAKYESAIRKAEDAGDYAEDAVILSGDAVHICSGIIASAEESKNEAEEKVQENEILDGTINTHINEVESIIEIAENVGVETKRFNETFKSIKNTKQEADGLLAEAKNLINSKCYEDAITRLNKVNSQYGDIIADLDSLSKELVEKIENKVANEIENASNEIGNVQQMIDDAGTMGANVSEANNKLKEAKAALEDAKDKHGNENYEKAMESVKDAITYKDEALDEKDKALEEYYRERRNLTIIAVAVVLLIVAGGLSIYYLKFYKEKK